MARNIQERTKNPRSKTIVTVVSKAAEKPPAQAACLVVIYGLELGRKHNLKSANLVIGRSSKADVQIDQESVSRHHAKITGDGGSIVVRDLGSTNGTYVNDQLIDEYVLKDGDFIKVGRTIFKFLSSGNIENAYHEEIYRLTTIDGLTQVFNRRYLLEQLEREVSRAKRYRRALSLIIFDIDRFKLVNDTYGHIAGDSILKQMATVVRGKIRREDVLARYGGEEFAIILPETAAPNAVAFAEKVRRLVEKAPFSFEDTNIVVTVSVGVAGSDGAQDAAALVQVADEKLYEAKNLGRNCVRV